ncbi:MAG TPA: nucleotide exchange factor GrpE [Pseudohongiella sp.]|nr:nucleotide exchange factor GrpE [Pseudohongiella sp.]
MTNDFNQNTDAGSPDLQENPATEEVGQQTAEGGDSTEDLAARLAAAEAVIAGHQTEVLRLHADMQNVRRRAEMEVEKALKFGQEKLLNELLPVLDNLERALQASEGHAETNEQVSAIREGVELTLKSFVDCLQKFNVAAVDPVGEPFDPQFHEAMGMVESPTAEPDSVLHVLQKGYTLNGRVLRPARVMVARAPSAGVDVTA